MKLKQNRLRQGGEKHLARVLFSLLDIFFQIKSISFVVFKILDLPSTYFTFITLIINNCIQKRENFKVLVLSMNLFLTLCYDYLSHFFLAGSSRERQQERPVNCMEEDYDIDVKIMNL